MDHNIVVLVTIVNNRLQFSLYMLECTALTAVHCYHCSLSFQILPLFIVVVIIVHCQCSFFIAVAVMVNCVCNSFDILSLFIVIAVMVNCYCNSFDILLIVVIMYCYYCLNCALLF